MNRKEKGIAGESRVYLFEVFNSRINLRFSLVHSLLSSFEREGQLFGKEWLTMSGRHNSTRDGES